MSAPSGRAPAVGLVGLHGYGAVLLAGLRALERRGALRLAGLADPRPPDEPAAAPWFGDHRGLLASAELDVLVVATPPHRHAEVACDAFDAGLAVMLEKPVAPTVADTDALIAARAAVGVPCQVGYQAQASPAVRALRALVDGGALGAVTFVGGAGRWQRDETYFRRSDWAGRLHLDGRPVLDGVLANPFSHMVMLALHLAGPGPRAPAEPRHVYAERYRANDISSDDTAYVRVETDTGATLSLAATLCAERETEPFLVVRGDAGEALLRWESEQVEMRDRAGTRHTSHTRPPRTLDPREHQRRALLLDLLAAWRAGQGGHEGLLAPLERCRGPVQVTGAALAACGSPPVPIPRAVRVRGHAGARRSVVPGVDAVVERAAVEGVAFSETGAAWARAGGWADVHAPLPPLD